MPTSGHPVGLEPSSHGKTAKDLYNPPLVTANPPPASPAGRPVITHANDVYYSESILRRLLLDDGPPLAGATACYSDYYSDDAFGGSD